MTAKFQIKKILLLGLTLSTINLWGSPQVPDFIIFKGDTIATYNLILERYLQSIDTAEVNQLFGLSFRDGASTNCWRGYQAIYLVENQKLFLVAIIGCGELRSKRIDRIASLERLKGLFQEKVVDERVSVDWYSGIVSFPLNNKILRWDGVFYTTFERETVMSITNGLVTMIEEVNNYEDDPAGINRRDKDVVSDILFKRLKKAKWKSSDECDCSEKYLVTIDETGRVSKVVMLGYETDDEIDKYWDRAEFNYCINSIANALKDLKFDVIKRKGQPVSEDIYLEIWVTEKGRLENWTR